MTESDPLKQAWALGRGAILNSRHQNSLRPGWEALVLFQDDEIMVFSGWWGSIGF